MRSVLLATSTVSCAEDIDATAASWVLKRTLLCIFDGVLDGLVLVSFLSRCSQCLKNGGSAITSIKSLLPGLGLFVSGAIALSHPLENSL